MVLRVGLVAVLVLFSSSACGWSRVIGTGQPEPSSDAPSNERTAADPSARSTAASAADGGSADGVDASAKPGMVPAADGGAGAVPAGPPASPASPPAPPAPPAPPIVPDAKRVFETSRLFTGDLATAGWATTGLDGADNLCNSAAIVANLGGTWRAWLSAPGQSAADRIADVGPWYLVDRRTKVFDTKFGLGRGSMLPQLPGVDVGPLVDITMNELGLVSSPASDDWTGTEATGKASPFDCQGWTSDAPTAGEGLVGIGPVDFRWWTDSVTNPCSNHARLLCFEQ